MHAVVGVVVSLKKKRFKQVPPTCVDCFEPRGLLCLRAHNAKAPLSVGGFFADEQKIALGLFEFSTCFDFAGSELCDAGSFFENRAPFDGVGEQHGVDFALLDDRVCIGANARVEKEFLDVAQPYLATVDEVVALAVAKKATCNINNLGVDVEGARSARRIVVVVIVNKRVFESQRDGRTAHRFSRSASCENYIHHRFTAKTLCAPFAKDPFDCVDDVALATTVWANNSNYWLVEVEFGFVSETLETRER